VWEFWWPLFPALIYITQTFPDRTAGDIALAHLPLSVAAIFAGWFFVIRRIPRQPPVSSPACLPVGKAGGQGRWENSARGIGVVASTMWPVAFVVLVVALAPNSAGVGSAWLLAGSLLVVDSILAILKRVPRPELLRIVRKTCTMRMAVLIFSVYIMRAVFDETDAAGKLPDLLTGSRVPVPIVCFFVPWIVGLLTGYTMAGVSTTFPLLMGLLKDGGAALPDRVMLAYVGSFMGVMMSPAHLCLVLTREYFGAKLGEVYRRLIPMYLFTLAAIAGMWLVLRGIS
jgi:hypothetical protein